MLKLAYREYKTRHGNVARMVHWKLCEKFNLEKSEKWYLHNPKTLGKNVNHKLIMSFWQGDEILLFSIKRRRQQ